MKNFFRIILILNFVMILVSCTELINPITISFDSKGGNSVESIRFNGGSQLNIPENPILEGFVFDGWFFDDDTFEIPLSITSLLERVEQGGSITVYAKWIIQEDSELTTQLKHIYNLALESDLFTGTYEEWLETVRGPQGLPGENGKSAILRLNDGYIEWKLEGDDIWIRLIDLNSIRGEDGINGLNITLQVADGYIQWQYVGDETWTNLIEISTLTGNTGENGKSAYDLYKENNPDYIGDEQQWLDDLVNNRLGTKQTFKVTFDSNGGTSVEEQVIEPNNKATKPENPIKEGYTFDGWYINGDEKWVFGGFSVTEDITLTAHWIANEYTITLTPGLGLVTPDEIVVTYDSYFVLPTPISEDNYFMGWYYDHQLIESGLWSMTKNVELTAYWIQKEYQVLYNFGYGDLTNIDTALYGEEYAPISIDRIGYTFSGWYTDSDQLYEGDIWLRQENLNLVAKWTPNTYTITFDLNGGEMTEPTTFTATYDIVDFLPIPTYTGVPFYGWYLDDAKFSNEQGEMLVPYNQTTDITLVAIFYIEVSTAEDLNNIRNNLDATYYLMNDIDLLGLEWIPIGDANNPFRGVINGQGFSINNLTILSSHDYVGLLGYNSGVVENLSLMNVNIRIIGDIGQTIYTGTITGYNEGQINQISNLQGELSLQVRAGAEGFLGGISGYNSTDFHTENMVIDIIMTGTLTTYTGALFGYTEAYANINNLDLRGNINGFSYVGGLIGFSSNKVDITNTINQAEVVGLSDYVGGLVASSKNLYIKDSYNQGYVYGNSYVGGIIGYVENINMNNTHNIGMIDTYFSNAGGLIGEVRYTALITNSSNFGDVNVLAVGYAVYRIGGLVGSLYYDSITNIEDSFNEGSITGYDHYVGGLVGAAESRSKVNIFRSYNSGNVSNKGNGSIVGGLIGGANDLNIEDSFNSGNVTASSSVAGGLVGSVNKVTIWRSFNSGTVKTLSTYSSYTGGLVGFASSIYVYYSINFGNVYSAYSNTIDVGGIIGKSGIVDIDHDEIYYTGSITPNTTTNNVGILISDLSQINMIFFENTLTWNALIWDFSNIDIINGVYPLLLDKHTVS
ncbi:MAG: InlB B-repeat-containing protein [Tenericutes bacterium]|nr:InlB B-repeat-containing protein [Mycoplasmatota bacterium]